MTRSPLLLDLFCGAGGAAMGYARAGFDVVGVDVREQPDYPFGFVRADALDVLDDLLAYRLRLRRPLPFVAVHASPPCQAYTQFQNQLRDADARPKLIAEVRARLLLLAAPYVIENVQGAKSALYDPARLCGETFGLRVLRHRLFETNWRYAAPAHAKHRGKVNDWRHRQRNVGPYVPVYGTGGGRGDLATWRDALGISWTDKRGLREAIPPAFTEAIGRALLSRLSGTLARECPDFEVADRGCGRDLGR